MDYKDRYNRLLDAINELQEANPSDEGIQNWVKDNVPELKLSEDERLRKTTIAFLKDFAEQGYENAVECIDWLEKQGEQKTTWSEEDTANHHNIMYFLNTNRITDDERECAIQWLKSLKQRLGG